MFSIRFPEPNHISHRTNLRTFAKLKAKCTSVDTPQTLGGDADNKTSPVSLNAQMNFTWSEFFLDVGLPQTISDIFLWRFLFRSFLFIVFDFKLQKIPIQFTLNRLYGRLTRHLNQSVSQSAIRRWLRTAIRAEPIFHIRLHICHANSDVFFCFVFRHFCWLLLLKMQI